MKRKFRLIVSPDSEPARNMALDEAIMTLRPDVGTDTIRFYGWRPAAVSIGYFQGMRDVVDIEAARFRGIKVIRRITGGGAVYHDTEGEITYSIVVTQKDPLVTGKVLDSYFALCGGIIKGLSLLGVEAKFAPINDIIAGGKKISGNAQTRKRGIILQHGTILRAVDPKLMFSVLKVSDEKIKDKMIANVRERVTSLKDLGVNLRKDEIIKYLIQGYEEHLDAELVPGEPTNEELELADELMRTKYESDEWNFKR